MSSASTLAWVVLPLARAQLVDWSWPQSGRWGVLRQGHTSERADGDPSQGWDLTDGFAISQEEQSKTARVAEAAPSAPSAPWLPRPPSLAQAHHNRLLELCGTTVQTSRHLQLSRPTISRRYRPFKVHLLDASVHLLRALIPATNQQRVLVPQARVQVL